MKSKNQTNQTSTIKKIRNKTYHFLRWTEKWTKTDMIYLARGGFWLTLGKILSSISTLILAVIFAHTLPKEVYGTYKYILSIFGILTISTLSGIDTSLAMAVSRNKDSSIYLALKTKIKWGLIGAIASIALSGYYFFKQNELLGISFLICSIFLPFMDSLSIYNSYLLGKKKFKYQAKYLSITKIVSVTIMITVLLLTKNIYLLILTYFSTYTVAKIFFLKISIKKFQPNKNIEQGVISYGKHLSILNAIGTIIGQIDKILVFHFLGVIKLATYSFAIAIPEQIKGALKNIDAIILPKFSQKNKYETKKAIERSFIKLLIAILLIIGIYILIAPIIYQLLFPQYIEAVNLSRIFSFTLIIFVFTPFSVALKTQKKIKAQYLIKCINSTMQITIMVIFIYFWDLAGLISAKALIKFIGGLTNAITYYYTFDKT